MKLARNPKNCRDTWARSTPQLQVGRMTDGHPDSYSQSRLLAGAPRTRLRESKMQLHSRQPSGSSSETEAGANFARDWGGCRGPKLRAISSSFCCLHSGLSPPNPAVAKPLPHVSVHDAGETEAAFVACDGRIAQRTERKHSSSYARPPFKHRKTRINRIALCFLVMGGVRWRSHLSKLCMVPTQSSDAGQVRRAPTAYAPSSRRRRASAPCPVGADFCRHGRTLPPDNGAMLIPVHGSLEKARSNALPVGKREESSPSIAP